MPILSINFFYNNVEFGKGVKLVQCFSSASQTFLSIDILK